MGDETCGTCGHCATAYYGADYAERADSVEQIIREWAEASRECDIDPDGWTDRLNDLGVLGDDYYN